MAPWRTREDNAILMALTPAQAKAFEPLLHQQARSDMRFRQNSPVSFDAMQESRRHPSRLKE